MFLFYFCAFLSYLFYFILWWPASGESLQSFSAAAAAAAAAAAPAVTILYTPFSLLRFTEAESSGRS